MTGRPVLFPGPKVFCIIVGLFAIYSCGPNVVVGVPTTIYKGGKTVVQKTQKMWLKRQRESTPDIQGKTEIGKKIQLLDETIKNSTTATKRWALSTIPLAGPGMALFI